MAKHTVAIAHDYLTQRGGAERVVLAMRRAFPEAPIYTTLYDPEGTYPEFADATIHTSWLNRISLFRKDHRTALPLLAPAANGLFIDADVVLVSSSGWAHGFPTNGRRLVYCYSPARWLYQSDVYLGDAKRSLKGLVLGALRPQLVRWDKKRARQAGAYLAISRVVRDRIVDTYGIESSVLPAPHSFDASLPTSPVAELADWSDYYLVVSRLLPYKNVTHVVEAFRGLPGERLVIVGRGPLADQLRASAPTNVRLISGLTDDQLRWVYRGARAIIAPSFEDYGLTPLEGGVYGKHTLALRAGGYLDTIVEGVTGLFFDEPTPLAIQAAVRADQGTWDRSAIAAHVEEFSEAPFIAALQREVARLLTEPSRP